MNEAERKLCTNVPFHIRSKVSRRKKEKQKGHPLTVSQAAQAQLYQAAAMAQSGQAATIKKKKSVSPGHGKKCCESLLKQKYISSH